MYLSFLLTSPVTEKFQGDQLYNCSPDILGKFIIFVTLQSLTLNYYNLFCLRTDLPDPGGRAV